MDLDLKSELYSITENNLLEYDCASSLKSRDVQMTELFGAWVTTGDKGPLLTQTQT